MKYMGSKVAMLSNGLGELVTENAASAERIVDLFAGSAAVTWYAAEQTAKPVQAFDLQAYSVVLARAVISRTHAVDAERLKTTWIERADIERRESNAWKAWPELNGRLWKKDVLEARRLCKTESGGSTWSAYGGHYFSPRQAQTLDSLLSHLPKREPHRSVCLASIIFAASRCAASPGHTAQPFSPTIGGRSAIYEAWKLDPLVVALAALRAIAPRFAQKKGAAKVGDAVGEAASLRETDLAIVDPPYSAVQYSRFYHVLETIACGSSFEAEGVGRYPPLQDRPRSDFSLVTRSSAALKDLLEQLSSAGTRTILTFPSGVCSNGLSGDDVTDIAEAYFTIETRRVKSRFSTLGGNHLNRPPREASEELILVLKPR